MAGGVGGATGGDGGGTVPAAITGPLVGAAVGAVRTAVGWVAGVGTTGGLAGTGVAAGGWGSAAFVGTDPPAEAELRVGLAFGFCCGVAGTALGLTGAGRGP